MRTQIKLSAKNIQVHTAQKGFDVRRADGAGSFGSFPFNNLITNFSEISFLPIFDVKDSLISGNFTWWIYSIATGLSEGQYTYTTPIEKYEKCSIFMNKNLLQAVDDAGSGAPIFYIFDSGGTSAVQSDAIIISINYN